MKVFTESLRDVYLGYQNDVFYCILKEIFVLLNRYFIDCFRDIFVGQKDVFYPDQIRAGLMYTMRDSLMNMDDTLNALHIYTVPQVLNVDGNKVCVLWFLTKSHLSFTLDVKMF